MTTVVPPALPPAGVSAGAPEPDAAAHKLPRAGPLAGRVIPVSATLAANEVMAARRNRGLPVLPLAFGEAGLPVHPVLRDALASAAAANDYGPVAGQLALRQAAAGYWARRGLPTSPSQVVCGPGSKPLLFVLLLAIGGDVAVPRPSWVTYAAQAALIGTRPHFVTAPAGEGGIPDPDALAAVARAAAAAGRPIRSVVVTLPDNPTGQVASPATVAAFCEVAAAYRLIVICDEIYRDLLHDPAAPVLSAAQAAPERTVITTGASKNLALGGWRIGVARMPPGPLGRRLRSAVLGAGSEIWSAASAPVQQAAALAFSEPPPIICRVAASRALHAKVAAAVAAVCADAGLAVRPPRAGFYVYPDFESWRDQLSDRYHVTTSVGLARLLLHRYGAATLPGSAFGEPPTALRLRLATALLYGDTIDEQEAALAASDPTTLPSVAAALTRLREILADLANPA